MRKFCLMFLAVFYSGCATRIVEMKPLQRSELLATEQGRLLELTDPVSRTKSYITISEVLLSFASDAARDGLTPAVNRRLEQYVSAVQNARDTLVMSDRDARRHPAGFRDLEVAARHHLQLLHDLRSRAIPENRKSIEDAITEASSVRNEMSALLVPGKSGEH
jgi:hypothetical protein